jgi:hypothetical protein
MQVFRALPEPAFQDRKVSIQSDASRTGLMVETTACMIRPGKNANGPVMTSAPKKIVVTVFRER